MRYLLDTSPWANNVLIPEVIPARIQKLLDNAETKGLCSVSLLECAIHHRHGRLQLKGALPEFFKRGLASATNDLPENFPGDPFDRVIATTAKIMNLTLITCDSAIRDAQFCKVEFYPFKPSRLKA